VRVVIGAGSAPHPHMATPRARQENSMKRPASSGAWLLALCASAACAQQEDTAVVLDQIDVVGRRANLVGEAISASEGSVGQEEIESRPLQRSGDLLEFVPGLVATQHSGSGKANQYFLRGFNLDHGTDFATSVDAMPVNMRTHGHGQGWTDLNFLIPETVEELSYRKGTYSADTGDFSSTGAARFHLADRLERGQAQLTLGEFGYGRGVVVDSVDAGAGAWLYGAEVQVFDGPWTDLNEDVAKANGLLRYSQDIGGGRAHVMVMGYENTWRSADQIPQRAVDAGTISEFGSLDTTVGGESSRYSLSGGWSGEALSGRLDAQAYWIASELDLFSNFTYLLDDPDNGDQFEQVDERSIVGFEVAQQWEHGKHRWRVGAEGRFDDIDDVALYRTRARERQSTVRRDAVQEDSVGMFAAHEYRFSDRLRSYVGLRYDRFDFDVDARSLPENSGEARASTPSAKMSLAWQPTATIELYGSFGQGFHSNDARGTTIRIDPVSGEPAAPVDPLVDSEGKEFGARVFLNDRWHATMAVWRLTLDSELLFVGDAGNTEASRPSEREGIELGVYWFGASNLTADLELSYTDARFRDDDPIGDNIPGAIPLVVSAGISGRSDNGWLASARLRHFGPYPLIEDGSTESDGSTMVNLRVGREWERYGVYLDVFNALDRRDHDIDYFYASRLAGEPEEGVEDLHFHVFQPRNVRLTVRYRF
jgi:hypothetical protein